MDIPPLPSRAEKQGSNLGPTYGLRKVLPRESALETRLRNRTFCSGQWWGTSTVPPHPEPGTLMLAQQIPIPPEYPKLQEQVDLTSPHTPSGLSSHPEKYLIVGNSVHAFPSRSNGPGAFPARYYLLASFQEPQLSSLTN